MQNYAISVPKTICIKMQIKVSLCFTWLKAKVGFNILFQVQFHLKKPSLICIKISQLPLNLPIFPVIITFLED